jgi:hypothetical protein
VPNVVLAGPTTSFASPPTRWVAKSSCTFRASRAACRSSAEASCGRSA